MEATLRQLHNKLQRVMRCVCKKPSPHSIYSHLWLQRKHRGHLADLWGTARSERSCFQIATGLCFTKSKKWHFEGLTLLKGTFIFPEESHAAVLPEPHSAQLFGNVILRSDFHFGCWWIKLFISFLHILNKDAVKCWFSFIFSWVVTSQRTWSGNSSSISSSSSRPPSCSRTPLCLSPHFRTPEHRLTRKTRHLLQPAAWTSSSSSSLYVILLFLFLDSVILMFIVLCSLFVWERNDIWILRSLDVTHSSVFLLKTRRSKWVI